MNFCVDCRIDDSLENDFLNLNLNGKPVFCYVIQELIKIIDCLKSDTIFIATNSEKISNTVKNMLKMQFSDTVGGRKICITNEMPSTYPLLIVSGRAAFLKNVTIEKALSEWKEGFLYSAVNSRVINTELKNPNNAISFLGDEIIRPVNAFTITDGINEISNAFLINETEGVVINTKNDFELALILKRKEDNQKILQQSIKDRIEEKKHIFQDASNEKGVCLIGHSQIDNWLDSRLGELSLRNCGVRGISSFEYTDYILKSDLLACAEDIYVIMHGTNDIVYDYSLEQIAKSIDNTVQYIKDRRPSSKIYFLQCIHVNGRLDRNNRHIDLLNSYLKTHMKDIRWINTDILDDEFKNLKEEYTIDGLHLSLKGYEILKQILEREILRR